MQILNAYSLVHSQMVLLLWYYCNILLRQYNTNNNISIITIEIIWLCYDSSVMHFIFNDRKIH